MGYNKCSPYNSPSYVDPNSRRHYSCSGDVHHVLEMRVADPAGIPPAVENQTVNTRNVSVKNLNPSFMETAN
ncbi:hypothetical protein LIER_38754 [Lithospermum erythrorhizon]|uniref:Uncharacterized protein n=1 Tax=Lithospermum erythrorhizon TaxID=34254 RepID=A0AAV3Q8G5_LITER